MAKLCDKCGRCHTGECPTPPTAEEVSAETSEFIKKVDAAHKATEGSKMLFGGDASNRIYGMVVCDHAASKSPYCEMCCHSKPHKARCTCEMTHNTGCKVRPWVGRVECVPCADNDGNQRRETEKGERL